MRTRVHILGASGSGTTAVGTALAHRLAIPHFDTDDYYWLPSKPPFAAKRPVEERLRLLDRDAMEDGSWVLSGSLCGWGDPLIPRFTHVLYLDVPTSVRLARLERRELERYGELVARGGDMFEQSAAFLSWASEYESGGLEMRSRARHTLWLEGLQCPVLHVDGTRHIEQLVRDVTAILGRQP
ncbi:MAG TPA: AAA family ATPase [Blastocatellia bacterium]|nr:AAA family ATPase [Blastocatellia bacterium]